MSYSTNVLRNSTMKYKLIKKKYYFKKENIMKKTIVILSILLIATTAMFATVVDGNKSIIIKAPVEGFAIFGVSTSSVHYTNFKTKALFENAVQTTIEKEIAILDLKNDVAVGYLSGINNTASAVSLYVTTSDLVSGNNTIGLKVVNSYSSSIPGSSDSKFGTLENTILKIKETTPGAAALAPAGKYEATVTISLTSNT